jgi:hypothetical protein
MVTQINKLKKTFDTNLFKIRNTVEYLFNF